MKKTLLVPAFLLVSAVAFAIGNVTAARGAAHPCPGGATPLPAEAAGTHTVVLSDGESRPIDGTLTSATAVERPCDLIVFENGASRIIPTSPSGTALHDLALNGSVSASGNPLGYTCSIELKYTIP